MRFENGEFQLVGARLGRDDDGGGAGVFGGGSTGFDADFADRFQTLEVGRAAEFAVVGRGTVLNVVSGIGHQAGDADGAAGTVGIFNAGGDVGEEGIEVAAVDGEFFNPLRVERRGVGGIGRVNEGDGIGDDHGLGDLAGEQDGVDHSDAAHSQIEVAFPSFHTGHFNPDLVSSDVERGGDEEAFGIGDGVGNATGIEVANDEFRPGEHCTRGVLDGALDGATSGAGLREHRHSKKEQRDQKCGHRALLDSTALRGAGDERNFVFVRFGAVAFKEKNRK